MSSIHTLQDWRHSLFLLVVIFKDYDPYSNISDSDVPVVDIHCQYSKKPSDRYGD